MTSIPSSLYRPVEMPARSDKVIKSPRLAAIGVATLSGLMPTFRDAIITPIMMSPAEFQLEPTLAVQDATGLRWCTNPTFVPFFVIPSSKEAMKAVATLEAHSSTAWLSLKCPSGIQLKITAAMEARNPTTVAWT